MNLYGGKTAVKFNIPEVEEVDRLQDLIRKDGNCFEPASQTALEAVLAPRYSVQALKS